MFTSTLSHHQPLADGWLKLLGRQVNNSYCSIMTNLTVGRKTTNRWPTVNRRMIESYPTYNRHLKDIWPTINRQLTDRRSTVNRQMSDSKPRTRRPTVFLRDLIFTFRLIFPTHLCSFHPQKCWNGNFYICCPRGIIPIVLHCLFGKFNCPFWLLAVSRQPFLFCILGLNGSFLK